jgi:AcrR family transcriptional regulator
MTGLPKRDEGATVTPLASQWYDRMPPRPGPELDRALDAVERCLARYGVDRTSMTDIAHEMGVARTTLYRQVSSLAEALALVSSRRFHRFLDELLELSAHGITAEVFVQVIVRTVRSALADPVAQRVLHEEPGLVGAYVTSGSLRTLAGQITELLAPVVAAAVHAGAIRTTDPAMVAGWIVRLVFALCALPADDDDLESTVRFVLQPMLAGDQ